MIAKVVCFFVFLIFSSLFINFLIKSFDVEKVDVYTFLSIICLFGAIGPIAYAKEHHLFKGYNGLL
jgi:hypothetical protein